MKKWFILGGILFVFFIGGYFVLSFYAVKFIQLNLQKGMEPGFTLAEMKLKPTYLAVSGIQYEDLDSNQRFLQIEQVRIYPSLFSLLGKTLQIREVSILQPSFFFYRSREGNYFGPWITLKKEKEERGVSEERRARREEPHREPLSIQIDRIRIQKGAVDFEDRKVGEPPASIRLRELDLEIKNIRYPLAHRHSPAELKGKVKGKQKEGSIEMKGWVNLATMDLEALLQIQEIEVETFEPYYRKRVSAEIDSGTMDMSSQIVLKDKKIDATGELDFINLRIQKGGKTVFWIPADLLISLLEKKRNQVKAPFHLKGNLEDPQFNLQETFLTQIAFSLMEGLGLPIKRVGEIVGGTEKGVEGIKSIQEMFKKKKKR